ncbi:hypothetical protein [Fodinibius saliphilus]|uniref:hypothetical protein n=1 Tax=Fodinibius saliphilus TaxID=1920650 RepID=UPI0011092C34|nr:hypothetical protein [Fodinibius saliphilus]
MDSNRAFVLVIVIWIVAFTNCFAQSKILIKSQHWAYEYIERLQNRGHLRTLNPTAIPYNRGEVWEAVQEVDRETLSPLSRQWLKKVENHVKPEKQKGSYNLIYGGELTGRATRINSGRTNVLRPTKGGESVYPHWKLTLYGEWKNIVLQTGLMLDRYYIVDPDGYRTAARPWLRAEDSYIGYDKGHFSAYLGRFRHHWGLNSSTSGIISKNPVPFDNFYLRFGKGNIQFRTILGELDSVTEGQFDNRIGANTIKRYFFGHRLDWLPSKHFMVSLLEGEIVSGEHLNLPFRHLNPLNFLFVDSSTKPKQYESSNIMIALAIDAYWNNLRVNSQFILDDLVVEDREELEESGELKPMAYTFINSVSYASIEPYVDLGVRYNMVSSMSYRGSSSIAEDRWMYAGRGLATNFSDYTKLQLYAHWYADRVIPGLRLGPSYTLLSQGELGFRQPFDYKILNDSILHGTIEKTHRFALQLEYQPVELLRLIPSWESFDTNVRLRADVGYNHVLNENHIVNVSNNKLVGMFQLDVRLAFN